MTRKRPRNERRQIVALGVAAGKSNRAIAKELGVDEGTVRRDRQFLATPEHERPIKLQRGKPRRRRYDLRSADGQERHIRRVLRVAKPWILQQDLILSQVEYVLSEAGKLLYRSSPPGSLTSTMSPAELLLPTRPPWNPGEYVPDKLRFYSQWLARWLFCCFPREERLRDEVLKQISAWARTPRCGFVI